MQQLLNTLYITEPEAKLCLRGEALHVTIPNTEEKHIPLHELEKIIIFSYVGGTAPLYDECAKRGIGLFFLSPEGRFRYSIAGPQSGNVLVRKKQYLLSESKDKTEISKVLLEGKIKNSSLLIEQAIKNHGDPNGKLKPAVESLLANLNNINNATGNSELFGIEGQAAKTYFSVFGDMIRSSYPDFQFYGRSKRPPTDPINAMLSFAYSLLAADCTNALLCSGLDPYVGFLHSDRPGKPSLALDLMESFRPLVADRLILRLVNLNMVKPEQFEKVDGAVKMNKECRQILLQEWNKTKIKEIYIPFVDKKAPMGLLPILEAQRLANCIRLNESYSPITWR